jgi:hypothetical protein
MYQYQYLSNYRFSNVSTKKSSHFPVVLGLAAKQMLELDLHVLILRILIFVRKKSLDVDFKSL